MLVPSGSNESHAASLLLMNTCLSLRKSLSDCGNPRRTLDGSPRRFAPANEHTLFVIAKEPKRLRQSTVRCQMDCRSRQASFAMTSRGEFIALNTERLGVNSSSRDEKKRFITSTTEWLGIRLSSRRDNPRNFIALVSERINVRLDSRNDTPGCSFAGS
jgi:hypothetical protein